MSTGLDQIIPYLRIIGEHLLNGLILSAAIFLGSLFAFRLLFREQRWSASTRYQASLFLFLVLAASPVLTVFKPVPVHDAPAAEQLFPSNPQIEEFPASSGVGVIANDHRPRSKQDFPQPNFWLRWIDWPLAIGTLWTIFAAVCLFRLALAIDRLLILHHSALPLTVSPNLALRRKIAIAQSSLVSSPVAVGLLSPKVLLPPNFQSSFSPKDQENVLRHEIAHLERFDDWSNLIQQLCIALFPISPFLWILRRRVRLLEEIACDDWALVGVEHPKNYANLLTRLAANHDPAPLLVSGVSRRGKQLYQRVSRILDKNCNRSLKPSWRSFVLAALTVICLSAGALFWLPAVAASAQTVEVPNAPGGRDSKLALLSSEVIALLKNSALNDADAGVRREAVNALSNAGGDEATSALLALLNESKDEQVKLLILHRLNRERVGQAKVKEKLNDLAANEKSLPISISALSALARNIDDGVVDKFISIYRTASEVAIKESCLRGLARASSKAAKDFLMSVAKDDPDPVIRRAAVRAVSGATGKRIFIRVGNTGGKQVFFGNRGPVLTGREEDDFGYLSLGRVPTPDEMDLESGADLDDDSGDLETESGAPLTQRLERVKERIRMIPLPEIRGDAPVSTEVPPFPSPSPSNKSSASPSPSR
jgi:beta-lactamase regulating signal transducer with metallopeptidase domain